MQIALVFRPFVKRETIKSFFYLYGGGSTPQETLHAAHDSFDFGPEYLPCAPIRPLCTAGILFILGKVAMETALW